MIGDGKERSEGRVKKQEWREEGRKDEGKEGRREGRMSLEEGSEIGREERRGRGKTTDHQSFWVT